MRSGVIVRARRSGAHAHVCGGLHAPAITRGRLRKRPMRERNLHQAPRRNGGYARNSHKEIRFDAMVYGVERIGEGDEITVQVLQEIHRRLLAGTRLQAHGGSFRQVQNWIGGSGHNPCSADYVPPPPEFVPELMEDLCAFCNADDLPAVAQAAIAHAQFETIHPFVDGNGRTGRAIIHLVLRRRGPARKPRRRHKDLAAGPNRSPAAAQRAPPNVPPASRSTIRPTSGRGHARWTQLRIVPMQTLVGPLVDIAGSLIGGVTLAEGDHAPGEAAVGLLDQLEHEAVGCL
jgi:fido (protein-threonine AMPylation protein)